jgi:hypothetical protein
MTFGLGGSRFSGIDVESGVAESIGHVILWIILIVITAGIAVFFFPYAFAGHIINKVYLLDANGKRIGKLRCELSFMGQIGHAAIWLLLSIVTFGLAYFVYLYRVWVIALERTTVEYL